MGISQRALADRLTLAGFEIEKNGVQRIEAGHRFVTNIELGFLANVLSTDITMLLQFDAPEIGSFESPTVEEEFEM